MIEPGKNSDAKSVLMDTPAPVGSLSILEPDYFDLKRLRDLSGGGGYWISRHQQGTLAFSTPMADC